MVSAAIDRARCGQITIRPNRSLTARGSQAVFLCCALVTLIIASSFALVGLWPVLPFAGAELTALGLAMALCARHGRAVEVVTFSGDAVEVEKTPDRQRRRWRFQRGWVQILMQRPRIAWYPSRLVIRSHGREVELGRFLSERDRRLLAGQLESVIHPLQGAARLESSG